MTVPQFCSLSNLSVAQVRALCEAGLIPLDLPPDQAGRARLLQRLKQKGIPLSQLARAELPAAGQYVVYDHSDRRIDAFADPGHALARAVRCRGACAVAALGEPPEG